jgi:hypothetical protein
MTTATAQIVSAKIFIIKKPSGGYFLAMTSTDDIADFEILDGESYPTKIQSTLRAQQLMGCYE